MRFSKSKCTKTRFWPGVRRDAFAGAYDAPLSPYSAAEPESQKQQFASPSRLSRLSAPRTTVSSLLSVQIKHWPVDDGGAICLSLDEVSFQLVEEARNE